MLGIEFKIPNIWSNVLNKILDGIELDNFIFKIDFEEVLLENDSFLFNKNIYSGLEFRELINSKNIIQYF